MGESKKGVGFKNLEPSERCQRSKKTAPRIIRFESDRQIECEIDIREKNDTVDPKTKPVIEPAVDESIAMSSAGAPRLILIQASDKNLPMHLPSAQGDQADGRGAPSEAGTEE
jgi:hypothetical protein